MSTAAMVTVERPILFSDAMVRSILEGRKTQTRRVMKPQPAPGFLERGVVGVVPQWPMQDGVRWFMADNMSELIPCPYGKPCDLLWVREAHAPNDQILYRANFNVSDGFGSEAVNLKTGEMIPLVWKPSFFLARKHSRITLEITEVRVQRVQEISEQDAIAEGIEPVECIGGLRYRNYEDRSQGTTPIESFRSLWDSINAKRGFGWDSNPWVWAISFRRLA